MLVGWFEVGLCVVCFVRLGLLRFVMWMGSLVVVGVCVDGFCFVDLVALYCFALC